MKKILLCMVMLTIQIKAESELLFMGAEPAASYIVIENNDELVVKIKETVLTANLWHPLKRGKEAYSFSGLAKVLQSAHLHLLLDKPLEVKLRKVEKEKRGVNQQINIREIIVSLHYSKDGEIIPTKYFGVATDGEVIVFQKYTYTDLHQLIPTTEKRGRG